MRDDKKGNTRSYRKTNDRPGGPGGSKQGDDSRTTGGYRPAGESGYKPAGGTGKRFDGKGFGSRSGDSSNRSSGGYGRSQDGSRPSSGSGSRSEGTYGGRSSGEYGSRPAGGDGSKSAGGSGNRFDNKRYDNKGPGSRATNNDGNRSTGGSNRYDSKGSDAKGRSPKPERKTNYEQRPIDKIEETDQEFIENRIEGKNPVLEALKSGRTIEKLLIARGNTEGSIREIVKRARDSKVIIQEVDRQRLDEISQSGAHQGIIAYVTPYSYVEVDEMLAKAKEKGETPFLVILDEITDPHNLGAVIRTAECCGAHGVIIPKRRSVGLTPAAIKASAGAVEYVPVAKVTNISSLLDDLKEQGIWIAGADIEGQSYTEQDLKGPIALVIGSEGQGIGRLVKEKCDFLVKIPLKGSIESLNASVAAGILMYEVVRQRG